MVLVVETKKNMYVQGVVARDSQNPSEPFIEMAGDLSDRVFYWFGGCAGNFAGGLPVAMFFPSKNSEYASVSGGDLTEVLTRVVSEKRCSFVNSFLSFLIRRNPQSLTKEEGKKVWERIQGGLERKVFGRVQYDPLSTATELVEWFRSYAKAVEGMGEWVDIGNVKVGGGKVRVAMETPLPIPREQLIQVSQAARCGPKGCNIGERKEPDASLYAPFSGVSYEFSLRFSAA